jgi:hypothetical protein
MPKPLLESPSGERLLKLFEGNDFQISAPQYPTHYTPQGNGDMLDIAHHIKVRLLNATVCITLDSDHLAIISNRAEKFTDWGRFQSLASELISPRIQINWGGETAKAAREITDSIASAYRMSLDQLTLHKRKLRKL